MARMVTSPCPGDNVTVTKPKDLVDQKNPRPASPSTSQSALGHIASPGQSTDVATEDFEIASALKLIAISVIQQRRLAAKSFILHPTTLTLVALGFAYGVGAVYRDPSGWTYIFVICTTAVLATLGIVIRLLGRYNDEAEKVGTMNWLYGYDASKDVGGTTTQEDPAFNSDIYLHWVTLVSDNLLDILTMKGELIVVYRRAWLTKYVGRLHGPYLLSFRLNELSKYVTS